MIVSKYVNIGPSLNGLFQAVLKILHKVSNMDHKWPHGKHTLIGRVPKIKSFRCLHILITYDFNW